MRSAEYDASFMLADVQTNDILPADELQLCPSAFGPVAIFPQHSQSALVMARHGAPRGHGVSVGVWTPEGHGLFGTPSAVGALGHHALLHRRWGAYERPVEAEQHTVGQANPQKSESQPSNVRTRLKRLGHRLSGFSKPTTRHALGSGLFINRSEVGRPIEHGINSSETPSGGYTSNLPA